MKIYRFISIVLLCAVICSCSLTQGEHSHKFGEWMEEKAATCESEGLMVRYCECGEKQEQKIAKSGHLFDNSGVCSICGIDINSMSHNQQNNEVSNPSGLASTEQPKVTQLMTPSATHNETPKPTPKQTIAPTVAPTATAKPTIPSGYIVCSHCNGSGTENCTNTCTSCSGSGKEILGQSPCEFCKGVGMCDHFCYNCLGTGISSRKIVGNIFVDITCSTCSGTGTVREICKDCGGIGRTNKYGGVCSACKGVGNLTQTITCSVCNGQKYIATTATPKPTSTPKPTPTPLPTIDPSIKIGDTLFFGKYEQDNNTSNGEETIEWIVLDVKDGNALLLSKYALDCRLYNPRLENMTWEQCDLRAWMNDTFYSTAFSAKEKARIVKTNVIADKNPKYDTNPGNVTSDNVFLLSITEVEKYLSSKEVRNCVPTAYATAKGVRGSPCCWWLRSPGYTSDSAATVYPGYTFYSGDFVSKDSNGVRPVLWLGG